MPASRAASAAAPPTGHGVNTGGQETRLGPSVPREGSGVAAMPSGGQGGGPALMALAPLLGLLKALPGQMTGAGGAAAGNDGHSAGQGAFSLDTLWGKDKNFAEMLRPDGTVERRIELPDAPDEGDSMTAAWDNVRPETAEELTLWDNEILSGAAKRRNLEQAAAAGDVNRGESYNRAIDPETQARLAVAGLREELERKVRLRRTPEDYADYEFDRAAQTNSEAQQRAVDKEVVEARKAAKTALEDGIFTASLPQDATALPADHPAMKTLAAAEAKKAKTDSESALGWNSLVRKKLSKTGRYSDRFLRDAFATAQKKGIPLDTVISMAEANGVQTR